MAEILEALEKFFTEDDWNYTQLEGKTILRMGFRGKSGNWTCYAQAREEQKIFIFYSVSSINVPEEKRSTIAEFITRANYGLLNGNFEMDYSDGEVRYKTSIDVENDELTSPLVHNLVYANVWTMDRYFPGVMAVIYGNVPAADAIQQIEG